MNNSLPFIAGGFDSPKLALFYREDWILLLESYRNIFNDTISCALHLIAGPVESLSGGKYYKKCKEALKPAEYFLTR
ncbi:Polyamine aminopropyltransferase [Orchesella cincta]|uniref:Polyamine aminopropyltransferase n=1 Tax=Orchesella cincta TaxID=48709 RepID=A0A1D2N4C7_ORCCI|nr:Polyamine aminopropyltransferase [Orchesella cincta]